MAVNLLIKKVADRIAEQLRSRAVKHHRSLQGELITLGKKLLKAASKQRLNRKCLQ
jgi:plasmid stability protein